jgi:MFS family permease
MEEATQGQRSGFTGLLHANWYLLLTAGTACVGSFLYGTDQGVLSNLLTGENFGSKFPDVYTDPVLKGWVVSVLQLGAWLGALINGPLANKISRKYSITVAAFVSESDAGNRTWRNLTACSCSCWGVHFVVALKVSPTYSWGELSQESPSAKCLMSFHSTLLRFLLRNFAEHLCHAYS